MLNIDKNTVNFLVTSNMVQEVRHFLAEAQPDINLIADKLAEKSINRIFFVGCGSSKAVGDAGKYLLNKYSTIAGDSYTAWEFIDQMPKALADNTLVILISHSGKTEEVVAALDGARKLHALTLAIANSSGSPLAQNADYHIPYNADAMWECQLLAVYLLLGRYLQKRVSDPALEQLLADIPKLPEALGRHIETYEQTAYRLASQKGHWRGFYTITAGPLLPLAYKEGVITNMEFLWGHGSVIESGEFRHGPLEIVEQGVPFLFLLGTDASRHTTERALRFVEKYHGDYLVFDYQDFSMGLHPDLAPMLMFVPLEWFSFYFALARDHNPDDRRYYNKVTY